MLRCDIKLWVSRMKVAEKRDSVDGRGSWTRSDQFTTEAACARILERHRSLVSVQKPHIATANLARIIEAVLKLASRQSFHEMSLRDLSKASGISMGGLYSYFDGKNALLLMILSEVAETVEAALADAPPDVVDDPAEHLRWLIDRHVRLTEAMQPWFVFAYMEAKSFPAQARSVATESELATERIFATCLERGVEKGVFAIDDIGLTASLIKPLLQDWYVKRPKYRKRNIAIQRYIDGVINLVERAILSSRN